MKPITIVGGGLSGLTLGIALRRRDIPVTILEAGSYPRHRVCGEFLSGSGQDSLARLGLLECLSRTAPKLAHTAAFFTAQLSSPVKTLPRPALCISRFAMDEALAHEFVRVGGTLRDHERWPTDRWGEGIVRATGRRVRAQEAGWRWVGLKAHVRGVALEADLEMHLTFNGYVGLCRLAGDRVNICGLFRSRSALPEAPHLLPEFLGGVAHSPLRRRLAEAKFDSESFCATAGLSLQPRTPDPGDGFCIGDAITMTPPITGNGMSMALESSELAQDPLTLYSTGSLSWESATRQLADTIATRFASRLTWASILHKGLMMRWPTGAMVWAVPRWDFLWRILFEQTR